MSRAFSVAVNIGGKVNSSLTAAVKTATSSISRLSEAGAQGARNLGRVFSSTEKAGARSLARVGAESTKLSKSLSGFTHWGDRFQRELDKLKVAPREFVRIEKSWNSMHRALSTAPRNAAFQLGAIKAWETDVLKSLRRVDREQKRVNGRLGGALGVAGGGYAVQRVGRASIRFGADSKREDSRDFLAGLSQSESERLRKASFDLSARFPAIDATTLHERLRDTAMAMRDVGKAIDFGDTLAQSQVVLESLKGRDAAVDEGRKFFKGLDTLGVIDPKRMKTLLDGWTKALGVEGADLDMGGFLAMVRQSRSAGANLSDRFLMLLAPQLAQDMGDAQLGTSLASGLSQVVGGRATKESKALQTKYGLRDAKGRFLDESTFLSDPFAYLTKTALPALAKKGVNTGDDKALVSLFQKLLSNRTVSDLFTKMATQREQYESKIAAYEKAPGLAGSDKLMKDDPFVAWSGFTSQMNNLVTSLTSPLMPAATSALNGLSSGIAGLAKSLSENKNVAATAGIGAGAAGVAGAGWLSWRGAKAAGEWLGLSSAKEVGARLPFEAATKAGPSAIGSIAKTLGFGAAMLGVNAGVKAATGRDPLAEASGLITRVKGGALTAEDTANVKASQDALRKALGLESFFNWIEGKGKPKTFDGVYARDFTLGSKGGFSRTGTVTPPSRIGHMSNWDAKAVAPGPIGKSVDVAKSFEEQVARITEAGRSSGSGFTSSLNDELLKAESSVTSLVQRLKSALSFTVSPTVSLKIGGAPSSVDLAGARASGGPVSAGKTYLVGERGPELFRAPASGEIVPNHKLRSLSAPENIAQATGGGSVTIHKGGHTINLTINTSGDAQEIARAAAKAVRDVIARAELEQSGLLSD
ncbi:hypothetical protein [Bosea sp. MMO-172]|uniref:hypothetical protein n=1 Tax=Bosea sp. MMO-172 TaxID=3127885 RepID=UPI0030168064